MANEPKVNPVPLIQSAVRLGMSAREALGAARDAGVKIRDATWFRLYAEVKQNSVSQIGLASELLTAFPHPSEVTPVTKTRATGYLQYAQVYVRDRQTGVVSTRPFAVRTESLITRGEVVNKALNTFSANATPSGNYGGEQVIGAAYTATQQMIPSLPDEVL